MTTPHKARKANNPNRSGLDVGSTANSLNFPESGWWGIILSAVKFLIQILIGLLMVGCGKKQSTNTNQGNNTLVIPPNQKAEKETPPKGDDKNSTSEKPTKDLTAEEQKVIGSYVRKTGSKTRKLGLLENGKVESYLDGDKVREGSWKMAGNEVHINLIGVSVWRIESNGDLTAVASIKDEKREEAPIDRQATFKKIK